MADARYRRFVRRATVADATAVRDLFLAGEVAEFAARLSDGRSARGTTYYVAEAEGEIVAVFAITMLGRLRPGGGPRMLLHEIKLRANVRGTGVPEWIFRLLRTELGAGTDIELLAMSPLEQHPTVFTVFGLAPSHQIFKWPALVQEVRA